MTLSPTSPYNARQSEMALTKNRHADRQLWKRRAKRRRRFLAALDRSVIAMNREFADFADCKRQPGGVTMQEFLADAFGKRTP